MTTNSVSLVSALEQIPPSDIFPHIYISHQLRGADLHHVPHVLRHLKSRRHRQGALLILAETGAPQAGGHQLLHRRDHLPVAGEHREGVLSRKKI